MTHTAHIPQSPGESHLDSVQAMHAAFLIGRAEYDARMKWKDYDVTNALRALAETSNNQQRTPNIQATRVVVGGGTSLEGKIKWLLENEGEMTSPAMAFELKARVETIRNIASKLVMNGVIHRKSRGVFEPIKKGVVASIVAVMLLASATRSMAQRGTLAFVQPEPTVISALPLPALAPAPKKTNYLVWDSEATSFRVQVGASRGNYTNSFTVRTNHFPITNGLAYAVWSIQNGIESAAPGLWPSNRVGELWLTGMGTNFTGGTNIVRLAKFTNSPPGNMQFWGVANITTGWE